jgi:hypothetical protein
VVTPATAPSSAAIPVSSDFEREVAFITGVNADGTIVNTSHWRAHGYGPQMADDNRRHRRLNETRPPQCDAASALITADKQTFVTVMDMWSAVANVTFSLGSDTADVKPVRGAAGSGATARGPHTQGSGSTLGQSSGQWIVNMETSKNGFDLSGPFTAVNGYGLNTILHEVGHVLGL